MTDVYRGPDELEKLLADVQRTIRENDQFIRHMKEEVVGSDVTEEEEAPDSDVGENDEGFEEL